MRKILALITLLFCITSCVETIAVGTVASSSVMIREKSLINTKNDALINSKIVKEFVVSGLKNPGNSIAISVNEGRVLLTGVSNDAKNSKKAVEICWRIKGVKEVIDEIQIIENKPFFNSFVDYFKDSAITSQIEAKMIFNKKIASSNFKIITVNKVVYILGVAKDEAEITRLTNLISKVRGVDKVVSHAILIDDKRRSSNS